MKTSTSNNLYKYIQENPGTTARMLIAHASLNPTGIFKHLKTMQDRGMIYKIGKPPKVRYYAYANTMETHSQAVKDATNWAVSGDAHLATPEILCQTRDVFQARTDRLLNDLKNILHNDNLVYLIAAAVGEIGNNSFDHNIGQWQDAQGILFELDEGTRTIILADRGQGVKKTLQRVRPNIVTDTQALQVGFTEMVSGRAPEKRGNGLKFVKKVIEENQLQLIYYTGDAMVEMRGSSMAITISGTKIPGTLAFITF